MDTEDSNEKNKQDQVTQKQEKKKSGRSQISPEQYSILEDRRAMRRKTSRKTSVTSEFCIWSKYSSSQKTRQITLNTNNLGNSLPLKKEDTLLEDTFQSTKR